MTYQNYIDSIVPDRLHDECVCPAKIWVKDFSPLNHSQGARINRIAREEGSWGAKEVQTELFRRWWRDVSAHKPYAKEKLAATSSL